MDEKKPFVYDAFISYKHADPDKLAAERLHRLLEAFPVPRAVRKKSGKAKINRVFRDKEELPIACNLADHICQALKDSEFLIVICTPNTPQSHWVQKEIETFLSLHDREHILAVLAEGEPETSFPYLLQYEERTAEKDGEAVTETVKVEPLAADIRGSSKREIIKNLKREVMRIAAPLLYCSYDDLKQRRRERRMKKTAAVLGLCSTVFLAFGSYSTWQSVQIQNNYNKKLENQSRYLAETSGRLLDAGDRMDAALVALAALPDPGRSGVRPYVTEAEYALNNALYTYQSRNSFRVDRALKHPLFVRDIFLSATGKRLLSFDESTAAYVWDTESGRLLFQISPEMDEENRYQTYLGGRLLDDETLLLFSAYGARLYTVGNASPVRETPFGAECPEYALSRDNSLLTVYNSEQLYVLDVKTGKQLFAFENPEDSGYYLTGQGVFSPGGQTLAVPVTSTDTEDSGIFLFSLKDGAHSVLPVKAFSIMSLSFYDDKTLAAAEMVHPDMELYREQTDLLAAFDTETGRVLWEHPFAYYPSVNESASIRLESRPYKGADGGTSTMLYYTQDNRAVRLNPESGETLNSYTASSSIRRLLFAPDSSLALAVSSDGTVAYVDMEKGSIYADFSFRTDYSIQNADFQTGILTLVSHSSNSVITYRFLTGAQYRQIETGTDVCEAFYSPDGSRIGMTSYYSNEADSVITVLDAASKEKLFSVSIPLEEGACELTFFTGNGNIAAAMSDGHIHLYDGKTGQPLKEFYEEALSLPAYAKAPDSSFLLVYSGGSCSLISMEDLSSAGSWEEDSLYLRQCLVSEDGRYLFNADEEGYLEIYRIHTDGSFRLEKRTPKENRYLLPQSAGLSGFAAGSHDGRLAAVCCLDNKIRILNLDTLETVGEFDFPVISSYSFTFSPDDSCIYCQGGDGILRVYSLKAGAFVKVDTEPLPDIKGWSFFEDQNILVAKGEVFARFFNTKDFMPIADVEGFQDLRPDCTELLVTNNFELSCFPYFTLDRLTEEAKRQLNGMALTDSDRVKYNIN